MNDNKKSASGLFIDAKVVNPNVRRLSILSEPIDDMVFVDYAVDSKYKAVEEKVLPTATGRKVYSKYKAVEEKVLPTATGRKVYEIAIVEYYVKVVAIEADSMEGAEQWANDNYDEGELKVTEDDFDMADIVAIAVITDQGDDNERD